MFIEYGEGPYDRLARSEWGSLYLTARKLKTSKHHAKQAAQLCDMMEQAWKDRELVEHNVSLLTLEEAKDMFARATARLDTARDGIRAMLGIGGAA